MGGIPIIEGTTCLVAEDGESPAFAWVPEPPPFAIDDEIPVAVELLGHTMIDRVTFDLFRIEADGSETGPIRVGAMPPGGRKDGERFMAMLDLRPLPQAQYRLAAVGWGRAVPIEGEGVACTDGEDEPIGIADEERVTEFVPESFTVKPTHVPLLSPGDMAELASFAPHGDPIMDALLVEVEVAEGELAAVQATLTSPEIEAERAQLRQLYASRVGLDEELASERRRLRDAQERLRRLRERYGALGLVNQALDEHFGDDPLEKIEDLLKRREEILNGTGQSDRAALDAALAEKRRRLAEVTSELAQKTSQCQATAQAHAQMKDAIRAKFHQVRRTTGDHIARIKIEDNNVSYEVLAIYIPTSGEPILHLPINREFLDGEKELKAMIAQLKALWAGLKACEAAIASLTSEKAWLEANIQKLEAGAEEVAEIDEAVDRWFGGADGATGRLPHLEALARRLEALGETELAAKLRELFGNPPRNRAELEEFKRKLAEFREQKHAREGAISDEIDGAEDEEEDAEGAIEDIRRRRRENAQAAAARAAAARAAEEEARRTQQEAYERARAQAEAEARRQEEERRLAEELGRLRERASAGDEEALAEILRLIGLGVLDEITGDLRLGTILGGLLTAAQIPGKVCDLLKAMKNLFGDQGPCMDVYANEVIRIWRECAGLPGISSVEIGAAQLADAVRRMPRRDRVAVAAAIARVMRMHGCK